MSAATYARLRMTDPEHWWAAALAWRRCAALAGSLGAELGPLAERLRSVWSGSAGRAAAALLLGLRHRLTLLRIFCWRADQALSEFAGALARARRLLVGAQGSAGGAGLSIDDSGTVRGHSPQLPSIVAALGSAFDVADRADRETAARLADLPRPGSPGSESPGSVSPGSVSPGSVSSGSLSPGSTGRPDCTARPAEVRRWWDRLAPAERDRLLATEPGWLATTSGIPVADRDVANRLLLDRLPHGGRASGGELRARLAEEGGPRAYLIGLDVSGDGRAVVALGDPDRARHVLTHVPGMTSDLESAGHELTRAGRVAERAAEIAPAEAVSAVMWLDYDAPDFLHEAWSDRQARDGGVALRDFQESLRATQVGPPAHQTVLGHSYGSVVVGTAAAAPLPANDVVVGTAAAESLSPDDRTFGTTAAESLSAGDKAFGTPAAGPLSADDVVFVGSPGVGVGSADQLAVPADRVWATTSKSDVIQYAAVSPRSLLHDLPLAGSVPLIGPLLALGRPERDLWFGTNPNDPAFGARLFPSQPDAGHLGYWDPGGPALDAMAAIVTGREVPTRS
jgi:hypothetical protein